MVRVAFVMVEGVTGVEECGCKGRMGEGQEVWKRVKGRQDEGEGQGSMRVKGDAWQGGPRGAWVGEDGGQHAGVEGSEGKARFVGKEERGGGGGQREDGQ